MQTPMYIHVRDRLMDLSTPQVMGILNVTPDSFYSGSRKQAWALPLDFPEHSASPPSWAGAEPWK